mgnify:CR=1 FL=1
MRKIKLFGISPFVLTILFFLQALLFANNAFAQNIIAKSSPATLVTDVAGVLTPEQKQALENKLVAIDDSRNSQFNADIGLDFPLIDDLFTKISFMWNYDNQPAQGIEKIDRRLNIGLNFVW